MAIAAPRTPVERKSERIELRTTPSVREAIERAVAFSGLTPAELAYEGARRVIEDHERMVLAGADRDLFAQALMNPPKPAQRLVAAMKRRRAAE
ncbi:MAG: DUF1778 domain-containing protein [Steroidobacteraceae bacterium]